MAAKVMSEGKVNAIFVGADRIAANGDTANKIGTLSLAVNARFSACHFMSAPHIQPLTKTLLTAAALLLKKERILKSEVCTIKKHAAR